jgi:hypothetical protein
MIIITKVVVLLAIVIMLILGGTVAYAFIVDKYNGE